MFLIVVWCSVVLFCFVFSVSKFVRHVIFCYFVSFVMRSAYCCWLRAVLFVFVLVIMYVCWCVPFTLGAREGRRSSNKTAISAVNLFKKLLSLLGVGFIVFVLGLVVCGLR